ncbi:hypothetical protein BG262_05080 [Floricoccus penangensis]|uniref:Metallo-beta-lactamase domain-containing protein n=1 Tax=Floricoccus penangensis TaxID=1859475 RepID=A0A9Q5JFP7_9LACT|nr:MBL fold metallo-hydrolase [Floricoccus penangensis]OFI46391.1 hypothetical protein BG262_05080 [Floricoccus penangensis]
MTLQTVHSKIGDIDVFQVVEIQIGNPVGQLFPDATPDKVKEIEWLDYPHINADGTLNAVSQSIIVKKDDRIIVVDTCIGNDKERTESPDWTNLQTDFLETLENIGIDRNKVTDVLCTHLHMDHIGWNTYKTETGWVPTFPNAKYHFAKKEYDFWKEDPGLHSIGDGQGNAIKDSVQPIIDAGLVNFIDEDAYLGDGISVFPTPGHTIAHISVIFDTGKEKFVITGDAFHHPCQLAHPEWCNIADFDKKQSEDTRIEFSKTFADDDTIIAGTHFSIPSIGNIINYQDGYAFKPILNK